MFNHGKDRREHLIIDEMNKRLDYHMELITDLSHIVMHVVERLEKLEKLHGKGIPGIQLP